MSDVVLVAAVTGGTSVLTAGLTGIITWTVSRNSAAVELAKVEAENERLQQSNREEERRNRQSTYHQHLTALHGIYALTGFAAPIDDLNQVRIRYRDLHAGVVLFGPSPVRKAAYEVGRVYNEITPAIEEQRKQDPDKSESECWRDATVDIRDRFGEEIVKLTTAMHADVTRGISDVPDAGK